MAGRGLFRHPPQPVQRPRPQRSISTYDSLIRSDGPVAYWHLDETTGSTAVDSVGANNGTYGGGVAPPTLGAATLLAQNGGGTAVTWNGPTNYSDVAVDSVATLFDGTKSWSIEAWVKQTTDASFPYIFSATSAAPNGIAYFTSSNLGIILGRQDAVSADEAVGAAISSGITHHVVGTYDGSNLRIYVDGSLTGGPTASTRSTAAGTEASIGNYTQQSVPITGTLDEVAVYNAALSATAILNHYNAGKSVGASVTASDTFATTDSIARVLTLARTLSDSITVGNTVARVATLLRTASDSLGISESVARIITVGRTAADSLGITDAVARVLTLARTLSDSLGISEAVTRTATLLRTAADSVTIAESVAAIKLIPRTLSDSLGITDAVTRAVTLARTAADSLGISESVARVATLARTLSDSLTVGNTVARVVAAARSAADSVSVGNTVARVVTLARTAADSVATSDAVVRVLSLGRTNGDSVTISESVTASKSGSVQSRSADDTITVSDAVTRQTTLARTAADSLTVGNTVAQQTISFGTAADSLTVGNTVARQTTLFRSASDSLTIDDSLAASKNGVPIISSGGGAYHPLYFMTTRQERARKLPRERVTWVQPKRVPVAMHEAVRVRESVTAVVTFDDDEDAIALLMLA